VEKWKSEKVLLIIAQRGFSTFSLFHFFTFSLFHFFTFNLSKS